MLRARHTVPRRRVWRRTRRGYLKRGKEIAEAIDRAADGDDRRGLDLVLARLAELAEDVRSVGGLDDLAATFQRLADALRAALGGTAAGWRTVAEELRTVEQKKGRGRAFWK